MRVLQLGGYDIILGMDWLEKWGVMQCQWDEKWIQFDYQAKAVRLQGVLPVEKTQLTEIPVEQVVKWDKGNDIMAVALIQPVWEKQTYNDVTAPIKDVLQEFSDVFSDPKTLPPHSHIDHVINLVPGAIPVNSRPYRYSPLQKEEIERQVDEMLKAGLITPSLSPFASPVLLVKKKDGSWRFCVDYRKLNALTIKSRFPLPVIDELLDELGGAKWFSKLDLRAGYHQIRMLPEDEHKTTFKTHHGQFQFRVVPFGLATALGTFQCMMNFLFPGRKKGRKKVLVFMDDILVCSFSLEEHLQDLREVLTTLRENHFYVKESKCSFGQQSLEYLGHIISDKAVATDPSKTDVMLSWPVPNNVTELRGFLGLIGYYRKFVHNYGILAKPLTLLLKKQAFQWTPEAQTAFEQLKQAMDTTHVLVLPNFDQPFCVETDACDSGVGAVLTQQGHPVAFYSKALGLKNKQLSIYEKEFLAIMMAIDKWRTYLSRGPFVIKTAPKRLCHLGDQILTSEIQR